MIENPHLLPTRELLLELLALDQERGALTWKERDRRHFSSDQACRAWNAKWAGREAFTYASARGYKGGRLFSTSYRAHRIIWCMATGGWPMAIDHIDGNPSNNAILNLREVPQQDNMKNVALRRTSKSGVIGVCWATRDRKWRAYIDNQGERVWLGDFKSKSLAVSARDKAEQKYGFHENHGRPPV